MSPSEGKIKAVNLEEISSQLFEYVVWEADRAVNVLTWEACLRSVGGDEDVKDNAKRRLNDILSVWKALGVVDFKPGKSRWSEGIVLNLAFFSEVIVSKWPKHHYTLLRKRQGVSQLSFLFL